MDSEKDIEDVRLETDKLHHIGMKYLGNPHAIKRRQSLKSIAMDLAVTRERQRLDILAQHGPVKILMKDGKPVEND